jgi:stage III sporulation protein AF
LLQALKEWLINICTAVFFITAVEIILPDNSMKKYAKFVLGLILITVFINPIIKVFDKNFNINTYTQNAIESFNKNKYEGDLKQYEQKDKQNTLDLFKLNLQTNCEKILKEKYPDSNYKVQVDAIYDDKNNNLIIIDVKVVVKDGLVEKIAKVTIDAETKSVNNSDNVESKKSDSIKQYISDQLSVSKDIIQVYKL